MKKAQNNLPRGMRARKRRRKNGNTVIYYFGEVSQNGKRVEISLGAIDNSKKEAKDLRYCFHATIPNLCHVPKHAYK